jgi:GAF domain-containing protein
VLKQTCQNLANELISHAFPFKVCIIRQYSKANGFTNLAKAPPAPSKEYGISWNWRSKGQPVLDPDHATQDVINNKTEKFCKDLKEDLSGRKVKFHNGDWILKNNLASLAIYPLISNKEVVGSISIYTGYIYQFSDEDKDFLANVSRLLAFLVDQCPRK